MKIAGYQIEEKLHESHNSLVYRARREADGGPVVLKMLKGDYPSPERIARFRREYEVTRGLNPSGSRGEPVEPSGQAVPGAIEAYSLESEQNRWMMVLEDFGGESLDRLDLAGQMALPDFLALAIEVSDILGQLHRQHIMHKDVNPSNIVLNPASGQVKLIDFGISTALSQETPAFHNLNVLEGTPAYVSPEQTGRMNRAMDYRTDFYSLGATFYELLAGQVPFPTGDLLELVHHHIAIPPTPPHELNPAIPQVLSEIVLRLMAKDAADRYQSAYGLKADLEKCLRQWQAKGGIDLFLLGLDDVSDRFQIPQQLYGREEEIETLLAAFERASQGASEMMLVSGYAGIGKTVLVQETYRPITQRRGYFISGKFDQLQRDTPYTALIQAFRSLVRQLLAESEAEIATWREKLLAALGPNGRVIIEIIPEVELILGPQPEVPALPPAEAQNRFNLVFQNFIRVFAQPEHGDQGGRLAIFLDDLQWADGASLALLKQLMTAAESKYLFLLGAYRDNEVSQAHPLMLTLADVDKAGATLNHLALGALSLPHVTRWLADTLHCALEEVKPLAELVLAKTGGNPFFIGEFLKSLYAGGLLVFDYQQRRWGWDLGQIRAREITDNVVDLLAGKVQQLPGATWQALQLAACIGDQFDLETLAIVSGQSPGETAAGLWAGLAEGLVLPLSDAYKLAELDIPGLADEVTAEYKFAHDRIQQAVYSLIPEADKHAVHRRVGQLLLHATRAAPAEREQKLFDIVNHSNLGRELIDRQAERAELAHLNLLAGRKAKASTAYQPALNYLQVGLGLLDPVGSDWQNRYDLGLGLHVEAAEAAYLNGEFEEMERLSEIVLQQARTALDKVKIYEVKIQAYHAQARLLEAVQTALQALELLDISIPGQPGPEDIMGAMQATGMLLAERQIETLIDLPEMTDPVKLAAMRIISRTFGAAFVAMNQLVPLLTCKQVDLSVEHGNAADSAYAYVMYGLILCGGGNIEAGYQFGQLGLQLVERFNARELKAKTYLIANGFLVHWKEPLRAIIPRFREAYQSGLETGDLEYAANAAATYAITSYLAGQELAEVEREMAKYGAAIAQFKQETILHWLQTYWQAVSNLRGQAENPARLSGQVYDEEKMRPLHLEASDNASLFNMYFNKIILSYLFHEFQPALEDLDTIQPYFAQLVASYYAPPFHFYDSLVRLAVFPQASEAEREELLEKVSANQEKMETWAGLAPANCSHRFYLVEAERARVLGEHDRAQELYDKAIDLAQAHGYLNEEALAYELAGRFYLAREQSRLAGYYLRDAHYAYRRWGAVAKVRHLEASYPQLLAQVRTGLTRITTKTPTPDTDEVVSSALDLASILKASQAISGEIVLDRLLAALMKVVVENAGAERGFLLLEEAGRWVIEAEGALDKEEVAVLQSVPIRPDLLPTSIVNYVARTQESAVLDDALQSEFSQDSYILARQPKSILCAPLINQGRLAGLLYLENNLATGAFTPDRLEVLNLLSTQAAISIENAGLYNTLEQRVEERTRELRQEIVERKRAEEAAKAASRAKSTFLVNMSHELRSPLNAILGFTQLMAYTQGLPPEHQEHLGIISRSGEHLLTIINQVLDMSKIEAGRATLSETAFDLYRLLDDLEDMFSLRTDDKGLQLVFERALGVPQYVRTDEVKLRQVLINLLSNAVKFTEEGGVTLRVRTDRNRDRDRDEGDSPSLSLSPISICFEVEDTGPGIAPDELDSLFEAFVQTKTGRRAREGTGLGLPISREFVRLMGGEMTVTSPPQAGGTEGGAGPGTLFKFDVVASPVEASDVESRRPGRRVIGLEPGQRTADGDRYRILVVDDKWSNRQLLIKLLEPLGFDLREAGDGQEAIEAWDSWQPHLIWMDIRMPAMDGYEATRHIKAAAKDRAGEKPPRETLIIALTSSAFEEERAAVLAAGCDDFLRKPFLETEIFDAMHRHLGVRFVYEEIEDRDREVRKELSISDLRSQLSTLPPDLLARLEEATVRTDMVSINTLVDEVRAHDTALAEALASLAYDFEYGKILSAIQSMKRET